MTLSFLKFGPIARTLFACDFQKSKELARENRLESARKMSADIFSMIADILRDVHGRPSRKASAVPTIGTGLDSDEWQRKIPNHHPQP